MIDPNHDNPWQEFEFYANQRIMLISYYSILFSLYVICASYLLVQFPYPRNTEEYAVIILSTFFIIITGIFWYLDIKNRQLIQQAKATLITLEKENPMGYIKNIIRQKKTPQSMRYTYFLKTLFIFSFLFTIILFSYAIYHLTP